MNFAKPFFLRAAAGAAAGGALFYEGGRRRETGDDSGFSKWAHAATGVFLGATMGAAFPLVRKASADKFKRINQAYGPNKQKFFEAADDAYKSAIKEGKTGLTAPSIDDFTIKAKAALHTYARPSVLMPAGMLAGGAYSSSQGGSFLDGAMAGGTAGLGLSIGYRAARGYMRSGPLGRAAIGVGMIPTAAAIGLATNENEPGTIARAKPNDTGGYDSEVMYVSDDRRRRMQMMGASGDIAFGLHNMRHG